jgi:integrase
MKQELPAGVYERGGVLWVRYSHNGRQIRESSHSTRVADAVALLESKRTQSRVGTLIPGARKVTFTELLALLETDHAEKLNRIPWAKRLERLTRLVEHFDGWKAQAIDAAAISTYTAARLKVAKRGTVNLELAALRRMFKLAQEKGLLERAPKITTPDPKNARQGFFEDAELARVLAALPAYLRPVFAFASYTGWRTPSEILPLTWAQVDWKAGTVRLERSKNGKGREFPFATIPALKALLETQLARTAAIENARGVTVPWVFHHDGRRIFNYYPQWHAACQAARCVGRIPHDLRRTAVRRLIRAGIPQQVAMTLTGHESPTVFARYAIVDSGLQREAGVKLAAFISETSGAHA